MLAVVQMMDGCWYWTGRNMGGRDRGLFVRTDCRKEQQNLIPSLRASVSTHDLPIPSALMQGW